MMHLLSLTSLCQSVDEKETENKNEALNSEGNQNLNHKFGTKNLEPKIRNQNYEPKSETKNLEPKIRNQNFGIKKFGTKN